MFGIQALRRLLNEEADFGDYPPPEPEADFGVGDEVVYTAPSGKQYEAIFIHWDERDGLVFIRYFAAPLGWLTGWVSMAALTPNAPAAASAS